MRNHDVYCTNIGKIRKNPAFNKHQQSNSWKAGFFVGSGRFHIIWGLFETYGITYKYIHVHIYIYMSVQSWDNGTQLISAYITNHFVHACR